MSLFNDFNFFDENDLIIDLNKYINIRSVLYKGTYEDFISLHDNLIKVFVLDNSYKIIGLVKKIENIEDLKNLFQFLFDLPFDYLPFYENKHAYGKKLYELFHKYLIFLK